MARFACFSRGTGGWDGSVSAGTRAGGGKRKYALGVRVEVEKRAREARDAARRVSATLHRTKKRSSRKVVELDMRRRRAVGARTNWTYLATSCPRPSIVPL